MLRRVLRPSDRERPVPGLLVDRDGVLNERILDGYVLRPNDLRLLEAALPLLRRANQAGVPVAIVSNQGCVARGLLTEAGLDGIHETLLEQLRARGVTVDAIYVCPHHPEAADEIYRTCDCRKPAPGLLLAAAEDLQLDLTRSVFLGDQESDRRAAKAAGCGFRLVDAAGMAAAEAEDVAAEVISKFQNG